MLGVPTCPNFDAPLFPGPSDLPRIQHLEASIVQNQSSTVPFLISGYHSFLLAKYFEIYCEQRFFFERRKYLTWVLYKMG